MPDATRHTKNDIFGRTATDARSFIDSLVRYVLSFIFVVVGGFSPEYVSRTVLPPASSQYEKTSDSSCIVPPFEASKSYKMPGMSVTPPSLSVPALTKRFPVNALLPSRTSVPVPDFVTLAVLALIAVRLPPRPLRRQTPHRTPAYMCM